MLVAGQTRFPSVGFLCLLYAIQRSYTLLYKHNKALKATI